MNVRTYTILFFLLILSAQISTPASGYNFPGEYTDTDLNDIQYSDSEGILTILLAWDVYSCAEICDEQMDNIGDAINTSHMFKTLIIFDGVSYSDFSLMVQFIDFPASPYPEYFDYGHDWGIIHQITDENISVSAYPVVVLLDLQGNIIFESLDKLLSVDDITSIIINYYVDYPCDRPINLPEECFPPTTTSEKDTTPTQSSTELTTESPRSTPTPTTSSSLVEPTTSSENVAGYIPSNQEYNNINPLIFLVVIGFGIIFYKALTGSSPTVQTNGSNLTAKELVKQRLSSQHYLENSQIPDNSD